MKITIGLTKRAEALLRELITGESFEVEEVRGELADAIALAESRRVELVAQGKDIGNLGTQERQAKMALESAEARLERVRSAAMAALAAVDKPRSPELPTPLSALRTIIGETRL